MENLARMTQDPAPLFWMQSTRCKGAMRRNRCSFVKVSPSESRNIFGNEANTQFRATMLPIHSVGFHGGPSTLRPGGTCISHFRAVTMETTQRISWWMLRITFCSMSKLRTCVERMEKTQEHDWLWWSVESLPDGWSQTPEVGPHTSTCLSEALHSQGCKTEHSYWWDQYLFGLPKKFKTCRQNQKYSLFHKFFFLAKTQLSPKFNSATKEGAWLGAFSHISAYEQMECFLTEGCCLSLCVREQIADQVMKKSHWDKQQMGEVKHLWRVKVATLPAASPQKREDMRPNRKRLEHLFAQRLKWILFFLSKQTSRTDQALILLAV